MHISTDLTRTVNRLISHGTKNAVARRQKRKEFLLINAARILSLTGKGKKKVPVEQLRTKSSRDIVINCLGCTDLNSDTERFGADIAGLKEILSAADLSFTVSRYGSRGTEAYFALNRLLGRSGITDLAHSNKGIRSRLYETEAGRIAVCACLQSSMPESPHGVGLDLLKEYFLLKRMGADSVIMYIDCKRQREISEKEKLLYNMLMKAGVNYIVCVKPAVLHSGDTYRHRSGVVSRTVYSAGTFLSNRETFPQARAVIRIKLRKVKGELQVFEEAYYPLGYSEENGLENLIEKNATLSKQSKAVLAKAEKQMPRLRRVDKLITVGTIVKIVGGVLPKEYAYIEDFTVGRISARFGDHRPGDVYVRWRPHTEANDASTYKERVQTAKKNTLLASKLDLFIVSYKDFHLKTPHIVVEDSMEAHISIGAYLREQLDLRCVAITGSIGKTSTKDMLSEVMKLQYNTVKSDKNANIHSKISLMLQSITSDCEVYIQELGGGRPGGASRHSRMVLPEATVVTNIGDAHLGNFDGDKMALMRNKLQIIDGMPEGGVVYLNGDDPLLVNAELPCKIVLYAVHNKNADYYVEDIVVDDRGTHFSIVHQGHKTAAYVDVPGEHNVLNAVCAFAIGKQFDIPEETIVAGISNFKTKGIRQNVVDASGMTLFFDCFNASSGSVESSIKTLRQISIPEHGKRIAVVGELTGLGESTVSAHKEIAQVLIDNPADLFIFYGTNAKYTYEIVKAAGFEAWYAENQDSLCQLLAEKARPGDAIMAKGSSKLKLEYVFDCVFGTRAYDSAMLEEDAYFRATVDKVVYNLFDTHATVVCPEEDETEVRVKDRIGVVTVRNVSSNFSSPTLQRVELPDTVRHIGVNAFKNSKKLMQVSGAANLKYIGMNAFRNCSSLESFKLPDSLMHIGEAAFMGCTALKALYIPESVVQIGADAFAECPDLKITCKAGSYAETYLRENHIAYSLV